MENKDIILIILVIIVLYLLFCDMNNKKQINKLKETFTTEGVTTTTVNPVDDEIKNKIDLYLAERKEIPITESIKNLGILAKRIQNGEFLTAPGHFTIEGDLKVKGKITGGDELIVNSNISTGGNINTNGNITLTKNIDNTNRTTTLSLEKSRITPQLSDQSETHSLNINSSIKFTNDNSNGLRFPFKSQTSQSTIYQKPTEGNLHIYSADSYINLLTKTAVKDELYFLQSAKIHSQDGKINMPNQILNELGGIEKLKFITPYYDFNGKKVPHTNTSIEWNRVQWNKYIAMAVNKPEAFVFVKHSTHRNGAPFILSIDKNHTYSFQATY